jgi:hypothetical protein
VGALLLEAIPGETSVGERGAAVAVDDVVQRAVARCGAGEACDPVRTQHGPGGQAPLAALAADGHAGCGIKQEQAAWSARETAMPDDGDAQDQEAMGVQDLVQHASDQAGLVRELSQETAAAAGAVRGQGTRARERAAVAKRRELAAHQRAIELHEQAAELQERLGHPDRAANARQHAAHARELLAQGRAEQAEQER